MYASLTVTMDTITGSNGVEHTLGLFFLQIIYFNERVNLVDTSIETTSGGSSIAVLHKAFNGGAKGCTMNYFISELYLAYSSRFTIQSRR